MTAVVAENGFFSAKAARFFRCVRFRRRPRLRLPSVVDTVFVAAAVVAVVVVAGTEAYNGGGVLEIAIDAAIECDFCCVR